MFGNVKKPVTSKHGKIHAEEFTLLIQLMRLEPKEPLKRIFLSNCQVKNLQKGAQAPFSFLTK